MSKQDRQGVRTARDIEAKYDLSKLKKPQGGGSKDIHVQQLTQALNQFMAETNTKFDENKDVFENKADLDEKGKLKSEQIPDEILKEDDLSEAINTALAQAKESGEFNGEKGDAGKTAYQYAKDGGYEGTETDFAEKLAKEQQPLIVNGTEYDGSKRVELDFTEIIDQKVDEKAEEFLVEEDFFDIKEVEIPDYTNLFAVGEVDKGLNSTGGTIDVSGNFVSTYILIKKGDIVRIKDTSQTAINKTMSLALYTAEGVTGTGIGKTYGIIEGNSIYGSMTITGNEITWNTSNIGYYNWTGFAYLRVTVYSANAIVTINEEIKNKIIEEKVWMGGIKIPAEALDFEIQDKPLTGKKVVCFGDSLFGMNRDSSGTPSQIAEKTGATVYNVGFGGCRMSVHPTSGYAEFSMWALAKAIAENNFSSQESAASKGSDYFVAQLETLKSIDFNTIDYVVIHYGTNDFTGQIDIGTDSSADDYTTLSGALRYSVEKLLTAYPKLRIFVSVPVYRFWTSNGVNTYSDTYTNNKGNKLTDFVEAIRNVAREYNLPVIDGYYGLGINKTNAETFLSDGTHHNAAGRERFGEFIGNHLAYSQINFPESGKEGSNSVQADLSQNDETAPDYVKGRTHYKEHLTIYPEKTLVMDGDGQAYDEVDCEIVKGDTYEVYYNGTKYTCIAEEYDDGEVVGGFLGNLEAVDGSNTGEPFAIVVAQGVFYVLPLDGSTEVTIEIIHISAVKIPTEYYDRVFYVDVVEGETDVYSTTTTPADIKNALTKDIPIIARVTNRDADGFKNQIYVPLGYIPLAPYEYLKNVMFSGVSPGFTLIYVVMSTAKDPEDKDFLTTPYDQIVTTRTNQL